MADRPVVVSLFAGVGGFDLGLERAGFRTVLQAEQDPSALDVLARHWPDVERLTDVRSVTEEHVRGVDLVCGGSPCQDLSVAGRGAGMDGERSGLFVELIRVADAAGDQAWVLWENVPGALSNRGGRDFAVCLEGFTGQRFDPPADGWRNSGFAVGPLRWCVWRVLDAQYFGVPQRRRRLFVVAGPRDRPRPEVLLEPGCLSRDPAASREAREVSACLTAPSSGGCRLDGAQDVIAPPLTASSSCGNSGNGDNVVAPALRARTHGAGTCQITDEAAAVTACTIMPHTGRDRFALHSEVVAIAAALLTSRDNCANPKPGSPAPTLDTDGRGIIALQCHGGDNSGGVLQGRPRKLTPLERERLQGFPDGWTEGHSVTARTRMTGNAVAVPVIEWIGRRLREAMAETERRP